MNVKDRLTELKKGSFYWVVPVNDPDYEEEWEMAIQPARYRGDGLWDCLGIYEGARDWPMKFIGDEVVPQSSKD